MNLRTWLQNLLPKIIFSPSLLIVLVFIYSFMVWTAILSFTGSTVLPNYQFLGFANYVRLWSLPSWYIALKNLFLYGVCYIGGSLILGTLLAILIDQKIRLEGLFRPIFLYPMALSFMVSGTAWKWFFNPGIGLEKAMQDLGFANFHFDWIINADRAIYIIAIVAVWQSSGFVMAIFLAGIRGISEEVIKAAKIDGANIFQIYWRVILPQMAPALVSAVIILSHLAIKNYDLVIALTNAGPGNATEVPATFMYSYTFARTQMGVGSASAIIMLMTIASILIPYLYSQVREKH